MRAMAESITDCWIAADAATDSPPIGPAARAGTALIDNVAQTIAAQAGDRSVRRGAQDLGRERPGVQVAGRLAARDHHAHERSINF